MSNGYFILWPDEESAKKLKKFSVQDAHITILVLDDATEIEMCNQTFKTMQTFLNVSVCETLILKTRINTEVFALKISKDDKCKKLKSHLMKTLDLKSDIYKDSQLFHISIGSAEPAIATLELTFVKLTFSIR